MTTLRDEEIETLTSRRAWEPSADADGDDTDSTDGDGTDADADDADADSDGTDRA
jgi:hypothetical protein